MKAFTNAETRTLSKARGSCRTSSGILHGKEAEAQRLQESNAETFTRMTNLFAEAKRIDVVSERRQQARRRELDRTEAAANDESFLASWMSDPAVNS